MKHGEERSEVQGGGETRRGNKERKPAEDTRREERRKLQLSGFL